MNRMSSQCWPNLSIIFTLWAKIFFGFFTSRAPPYFALMDRWLMDSQRRLTCGWRNRNNKKHNTQKKKGALFIDHTHTHTNSSPSFCCCCWSGTFNRYEVYGNRFNQIPGRIWWKTKKVCNWSVSRGLPFFLVTEKFLRTSRGREGGGMTRESVNNSISTIFDTTTEREREREIFCWQHVQNWLDDKASLSYCWTKDVRISTPLTFQSHCGAAELVLSGGVKFKTLIKRENKKMAHFPTAVAVTVVSHLRVNASPQE